jgi:hypothetical protein
MIPEEIPPLLIAIGDRSNLSDDDRHKLQSYDWTNRLWREKWVKVAEPLPQGDCENLVRGLVIVERELEWVGGSAAAAIWVFQAYERRFPSSFVDLANWVLQNRGGNLYLPYGGQTYARNHDEYLEERRASRLRYQDHLDRQKKQQEAKKLCEEKRAEDHISRREASKERAERVTSFNAELTTIPVSLRLDVIAKSDMPLEAISEDLLVDATNAVTSLGVETRLSLIRRIDRRNRGIWGRIKRASILQKDVKTGI